MSDLEQMLDESLITINLEVKNKEEMIDVLAEKFLAAGYVKKSYKDALLKRESIFPTGLDTGEIKVCMPHTDCEHVNKAGILIATLKKPIKYKRMDDPTAEIDANLVFMLAIKEPQKQAATLGKLMSLFSKSALLKEIAHETIPHNIKSIIINNAK